MTKRELEERVLILEQRVNDLLVTVSGLARGAAPSGQLPQYRDHWGNWLPPGIQPNPTSPSMTTAAGSPWVNPETSKVHDTGTFASAVEAKA